MSAWSHRIHAIKVTARRELFSTLYGLGLYVVLFVIFLLTAYGSIRVSFTQRRQQRSGSLAEPHYSAILPYGLFGRYVPGVVFGSRHFPRARTGNLGSTVLRTRRFSLLCAGQVSSNKS